METLLIMITTNTNGVYLWVLDNPLRIEVRPESGYLMYINHYSSTLVNIRLVSCIIHTRIINI